MPRPPALSGEVSGTSSTQLTEKEGAASCAVGVRKHSEPRRSVECQLPFALGVSRSWSATSSSVKRDSQAEAGCSPLCDFGTRSAVGGYMASSASSSLMARKP